MVIQRSRAEVEALENWEPYDVYIDLSSHAEIEGYVESGEPGSGGEQSELPEENEIE